MSFAVLSIIMGCLAVPTTCDTPSHVPLLFTSSVGPPPVPSQASYLTLEQEGMQQDPDTASMPGFIGGSQESGFSSEESDDSKALQPHFWDEGGEANASALDTAALEGNRPGSFQPSSPVAETTVRLNSTSLSVTAVDSLDPELWEIQSESSGSPGEPLYGRGSSHITTTDPDHDLVSRWSLTARQDLDSMATLEEELNEVATRPSTAAAVPGHFLTDDGRSQESSFSSEEEEGLESLTTSPPSSPSLSSLPPSVALTDVAWKEVATALSEERHELRHGATDMLSETKIHNRHQPINSIQVVCVDWSDLAGKGYVILNMSENYDCEGFRDQSGERLLEILENSFSHKMNSPQGSWLISLSKPTQQERQLLMTLASEQGVIATKDLLSMLGEIRRGLTEIGIQNFTSVSSCHALPSQSGGDYGKLFVVLVIIGSVCLVIIVSGLVYICWQRSSPKIKNTTRGQELHFVENGCHDNPTLDVTSDGQSEMQEKKATANGVMASAGGGSSWQVLVNKADKEASENMEEDTHL